MISGMVSFRRNWAVPKVRFDVSTMLGTSIIVPGH
jgi:hypothetical protein